MNKLTIITFIAFAIILHLAYKYVGPDTMIICSIAMIIALLWEICLSFRQILGQVSDDEPKNLSEVMAERRKNFPPPPPRKCEDNQCNGK